MSTMSHTTTKSSNSWSRQGSMDTTMTKHQRPSPLLLSKPLPAASGSSVSVNELPPPPTPGLRGHIGHLLPRHAFFKARIVIHQIQSVPFMGGEFGVRWKLKGVHTPTAHKQGLFDRVLGEKLFSDKGKSREDAGTSRPGTPTDDARSTWRKKSATTPVLATHAQHLSADWPPSPGLSGLTSSSMTTLSPPTPLPPMVGSNTPPRGMTPFLKLKDHAVTWAYTLDPLLKVGVDRENGAVLPCPLKLVVMQRVIPDDPAGVPQHPRLGAVYLNLAEYIGQGSVERRYLLRESKTNATLRIEIEMEWVSGVTTYIPPPLAKGEILTGLAGFLDQDVMRRRARPPDTTLGPYCDQADLELDLRIESATNMGVAFDVQRLPYAYGTKTTETLIDALFNPIATTERRLENPFTYYVPPPAGETKGRGLGLGLGHAPARAGGGGRHDSTGTAGTIESEYSTYTGTTSTSSSSESVHTTTSESVQSRSREPLHRDGHRAAPEGRVVVEDVAVKIVAEPSATDPTHTGVRGWWKRRTTRTVPAVRRTS